MRQYKCQMAEIGSFPTPMTQSHQTLMNRGPDSRFVLEAIIKALISKSSQSLIMVILNRVHSNHISQPELNLYICACLMKSGKHKSRIVKADY